MAASVRARRSVATADTAPVRISVIRVPSTVTSGAPVPVSNSRISA